MGLRLNSGPRCCIWVAVAGLMLAGCGAPTANVKGTVMYNGAPVAGGSVTFHGENKFVQSSYIDPSGNYTISKAPVGPVKVSVVAAKPRASRPTPGKAAPGHPSAKTGGEAPKEVVIPDKYKDPAQSGLAYTLEAGDQTIPINLQ